MRFSIPGNNILEKFSSIFNIGETQGITIRRGPLGQFTDFIKVRGSALFGSVYSVLE
jgi:hypothetical protein